MNGTSTSSDGQAADRSTLLAQAAELGDHFAVPSLGAGAGANLATLITDAAAVMEFVDRTRAAIATSMDCDRSRVPTRMAASTFHLNVVARLISPVIGAATSFGEVPLFTADSVTWRATDGHAPQLGTVCLEWAQAPTPAHAAQVIGTSILSTVVGPLNAMLSATHGLSTRVSWGNTISAANGAVTVMAMARPRLERPGRLLVRALLDVEPLAGSGEFVGSRFVRRSCCLYYQAPQGGLCLDCVLADTDGSHRGGRH